MTGRPRRLPLALLVALPLLGCPAGAPGPALIRVTERLDDATIESAVDLAATEEELARDVEVVLDAPAAIRHDGDWIAPLLLESAGAPRALALAAARVTPARLHRIVVDVGRALAEDERLFVLELPGPATPDELRDPTFAETTLRNHRTFLRAVPTDADGRGEVRWVADDDARGLLVGAVLADATEVTTRVERHSERAGWLLSLEAPAGARSPYRRRATVGRVTHDAVVLGAPATLRLPLRLPAGAPVFTAEVGMPFPDRNPRVAVEVEVTAGDDRTAVRVALDARTPRWSGIDLDLRAFAGRDVLLTMHARPIGGEGQLVAFGAPLVEARDDADARPDVVVVSLDTVRADRLSAYGFERTTSPTLEAMARDGVLFERAYTTAPWTLPSHVSLSSGELPDRHGVHGSKSRVHATTPWLPEALAGAGYVTVAWTGGGYVNPAFGFARGFDRYGIVDPAFPPEGWAARRNDPRDRANAAKAAASRASLLERLAKPRRAPLFAFVHTYVAHDYAAAPDDLEAVGAEAGDVPRLIADFSPTKASRDAATLSPERKEEIRRRYDATLRAADRLVADVLAALERAGRLERAIVVVLSDHGEELFERGDLGHGQSVHEEQVRVPLLIRAPGVAPARVAEVVSLVDVAPTVRAMVGLDPSPRDGRDLAPLLAGTSVPFQPAIARGTRRDRVFRAVVGPTLKLVRDDTPGSAPERALFDLAADPGERVDVSPARSDDAARLERVLVKTVDRVRALGPAGGEATLSTDVVEDLEALGYLGGE